MTTLVANRSETVKAVAVRFSGERLFVELSDGRELGVPYRQIPWLAWLAKATAQERKSWKIEPGGYAIYWDKLDDGIEVCHLLAMESLT